MRKRIVALPVVALVLGLLAIAPSAQAQPSHYARAATSHSAKASADLFLIAKLSGSNEVPVPGGPAVGDPDGRGTAIIRLRNNQVSFALSWSGIGTPTLGHIHEAPIGVNGSVVVPFFGTPMPDTARAAAGAVTVTDPAIAARIRENPAGFYVNLHTAQFPGGAIRGQLKVLHKEVNLVSSILHRGQFHAFLTGDQEVPVPGGPAVGDPDGRAIALFSLKRHRVNYSLAWIGINPILGHIHQGRFGVNGDIVAHLFDTPVPATVFALSGTVTGVDGALIRAIRSEPEAFYANLHTAEFPGGAVRGQIEKNKKL
jgi:hypothetical protein